MKITYHHSLAQLKEIFDTEPSSLEAANRLKTLLTRDAREPPNGWIKCPYVIIRVNQVASAEADIYFFQVWDVRTPICSWFHSPLNGLTPSSLDEKYL